MTDVFVSNLQFAFKLNTLLFPLDIDGFLDKLDELEYNGVEKGYISPEGVPARQGDVAVKNNTFINIDNRSQVIALSSISAKEILEAFEEIKGPLKNSGADVEKDVWAYSITSDHIVSTEKNAFEQIAKFMGTNDAIQSINSITGTESQQSSINLTSKTPILGESMFQLKIEPYMRKLGKGYYIRHVIREPEQSVAIEKLNTLKNNVADMIKTLEAQ